MDFGRGFGFRFLVKWLEGRLGYFVEGCGCF